MKPTIAAALPPSLEVRLVRAVSGSVEVVRLEPTLPAMTTSGASAYVIDPVAFGKWNDEVVTALVAAVDVTRLIVYTTMSADAMSAIVELVSAGVHHVLIAGIEDSPQRIRSAIDDVVSYGLAARLLQRLMPRLRKLAPPLRRSVVDVIMRPDRYATVEDVCRAAAMPRRSCDRGFTRVGLTSLRRLIQSARVLRAMSMLRSGRLKLSAIADRVGAGSSRKLSHDFRSVLHTSTTAATTLTDDTVLSTVSRYVCAPSVTAGR